MSPAPLKKKKKTQQDNVISRDRICVVLAWAGGLEAAAFCLRAVSICITDEAALSKLKK